MAQYQSACSRPGFRHADVLYSSTTVEPQAAHTPQPWIGKSQADGPFSERGIRAGDANNADLLGSVWNNGFGEPAANPAGSLQRFAEEDSFGVNQSTFNDELTGVPREQPCGLPEVGNGARADCSP